MRILTLFVLVLITLLPWQQHPVHASTDTVEVIITLTEEVEGGVVTANVGSSVRVYLPEQIKLFTKNSEVHVALPPGKYLATATTTTGCKFATVMEIPVGQKSYETTFQCEAK